jgi:hypothetical protein
MKYLQNRPNIRACKCPASGLIRPNTAGFGPTNGPTARSARDTKGWQVAPATVAIAAACIGAAARGTVTRGGAPQPRLAAGSRVSSMRHYPLAPSGHDRRTPSTTDDVGDQQEQERATLPVSGLQGLAALERRAGLSPNSTASRVSSAPPRVSLSSEAGLKIVAAIVIPQGRPTAARDAVGKRGGAVRSGRDPFGMSARFIGAAQGSLGPTVEGRPPSTIDVPADNGSTCRYCLAEWAQSGSSATYTFLYRV